MGEMSKTPEEIKKDLAAWGTGVRIDIGCGEFVPPTPEYMLNGVRSADVCRDALAMIQQLEEQNAELVRKTEQLERERDAAVNDLHYLVNHPLSAGPCYACLHENECFPGGACDPVINDHWKWRGISKEGY